MYQTCKKRFLPYEKKGQGLTITEKPLFHLVEEFASKEKVDMFEVNELVIDAIISKLTEEKGGTEWEHILKNLNRKKMCNLIKEKCAYHTYKDSMEILYRELDKMYRNGVGRVIAERVTEHFCCVMAFEAMSSEKISGEFFSQFIIQGQVTPPMYKLSGIFQKIIIGNFVVI